MPVLVLFAIGFVLRALFVLAGPDGGASWNISLQGDAPVWQDLAQKLARGIADEEFKMPWRPPGMQWFVSALWNGEPAAVGCVRWLFVGIGASVAPLLWLLLRGHVDRTVAFAAAALCAVASNLIVLSSGLHVESLYLALVLVALLLQQQVVQAGIGIRALGFAVVLGALHGALCLLRAEHVLTVVVLLPLAKRAGASWLALLLTTFAAAGVIAPWQLRANAMIDAYNAGAPELPRGLLPWDPAAITALRALPSFQQMPTFGFVSDAVRVRGGKQVTAADLEIVREAYGCFPEPLPHAFVALYGGLNFFLANTPEADAGFSRTALDRAPALVGGDARYPPGLRNVLPKGGQLAFGYPPHLDAVVHGTSRGLRELTSDPLGGAWRTAKKAWHAIEGMTGGAGGYALPISLSGTRRQVDLVTATGGLANLWRVLLLGAAAFGWWQLRRNPALWPLLAFAATKLVVLLAYFGYARQGALCLPAFAVGVAAACAPLLRGRVRLGAALLLTLVAIEGVRTVTLDGATVDDQPVTRGEPFGPQDFSTRAVRFR